LAKCYADVKAALPLARQHYCSDWTSLTARPRSCDADPKSVACSQGLADGPGLAFSIPTGEEGAEPLPSTEFKRAQPTTDTRNTARATMAHLERPRPVRRELLCFVSYSVGVPFDPSCSCAMSVPRSPNIAEVRLFRATGVRLMYVYIAGRVALPIMTLTVHR